ncbi:unnamed protein product, partial [Discosporangium mesarthrocarpum]
MTTLKPEEVSKLKVVQLREALENLGLPQDGLKAVLQKRLLEALEGGSEKVEEAQGPDTTVESSHPEGKPEVTQNAVLEPMEEPDPTVDSSVPEEKPEAMQDVAWEPMEVSTEVASRGMDTKGEVQREENGQGEMGEDVKSEKPAPAEIEEPDPTVESSSPEEKPEVTHDAALEAMEVSPKVAAGEIDMGGEVQYQENGQGEAERKGGDVELENPVPAETPVPEVHGGGTGEDSKGERASAPVVLAVPAVVDPAPAVLAVQSRPPVNPADTYAYEEEQERLAMLKVMHQPMRKWYSGDPSLRERFGQYPMFWQDLSGWQHLKEVKRLYMVATEEVHPEAHNKAVEGMEESGAGEGSNGTATAGTGPSGEGGDADKGGVERLATKVVAEG